MLQFYCELLMTDEVCSMEFKLHRMTKWFPGKNAFSNFGDYCGFMGLKENSKN